MLSLRLLLALAAAQQGDSQQILRFARDAQADFEWIRRHHLPTRHGYGGSACDERIGRFCFWHPDDRTDPPPPPEEPRRIRAARDRLVQQLDSVAALLPGDEWIAGQLVRYLVESGRSTEAVAAVRECRAAAWWCGALAGFALHTAGDFAGADSVYRAALGDMPREERCRWTDLTLLLEGDLGRRYRRLNCDERRAFESRLWWLAQPLYSLLGNDRRTEHLARATLSRIAEKARTPYAVSWGDDLREITLRYGWPTSWTQEPAGGSAAPDVLVSGHEPSPSFHFLADAGAFDDPATASSSAWTLHARRPRERYGPAYAHSVAPLEHQVALFRRGESCLTVAAYDVGRDTGFARASPDATLLLARDEDAASVTERRPGAGSSDVIVAQAECEPLLLSLEVVAPDRRHAARARYGVHPPRAPPVTGDGVTVSDILLFDPPDSLPTELAAVLAYVRGSVTARPDTRLGLFWEVYGLNPAGETVITAVDVVPARAGWLRRATQSLGLAKRRAAVRLEWSEVLRPRGLVAGGAGGAGGAGRALALELSGLSPGRYRVAVRAATERSAAVAARDIEIGGR
ncbi:MAG TPA: hypothetical protein VFU41_02480 [Gemmatimonadales bacterium]|nr:hypothetical protein [Gemmatimonadales bacterium]